MIIILGAGISGISAGYHLNLNGRKAVIYEKNDSWGGLCDNFNVGKFKFDNAIHLSFTDNKDVKDLFSKSTNFFTYKPDVTSYYKGTWLKHPSQNNLFPLPIEEKIKIIKSFINRKKNIESFSAL